MLPLHINHDFVNALPADSQTTNTPRQVTKVCYSFTQPYKPTQPELLSYSQDMLNEIGLTEADAQSEAFTLLFSGKELLDDMKPYAMRYAGHQFGNWAGQLGDGRAIALADIMTPQNQRQNLQLKGAGLTPYSRGGDGFAVLRSSIREFLCSEAMHFLGVPTTRALSLIKTGDKVMRDMFYDGRAAYEQGAIVCRVAPSFIRFGNFQIHAVMQEHNVLKQLADFTIRTHFSHLLESSDDEPSELAETAEIKKETYLAWLNEIISTTVDMIVHWQRVGFVHGVMNTDNMSIHGLTIDYGPYGWLDNYDPNWTPNTTDAQGKRYRFDNQPYIAHWNIVQFAQALFPLVEDVDALQEAVNQYPIQFKQKYLAMMRSKLGLKTEQDTDTALITDLESLLSAIETDMTLFYRTLAKWNFDQGRPTPDLPTTVFFNDVYYQAEQITEEYTEQFDHWMQAYAVRLGQEPYDFAQWQHAMNQVNPKFVLRNYLAQQAIEKAEQGDYSEIYRLQDIMRNPYGEQPEHEAYAQKRPEWARHKAGCSALSCSS